MAFDHVDRLPAYYGLIIVHDVSSKCKNSSWDFLLAAAVIVVNGRVARKVESLRQSNACQDPTDQALITKFVERLQVDLLEGPQER